MEHSGIEVCRSRYVPCRPNSSIYVPYKKAVKDFAVSGSVAPMVLDSTALYRGYLACFMAFRLLTSLCRPNDRGYRAIMDVNRDRWIDLN
jgi:hypothetical protein